MNPAGGVNVSSPTIVYVQLPLPPALAYTPCAPHGDAPSAPETTTPPPSPAAITATIPTLLAYTTPIPPDPSGSRAVPERFPPGSLAPQQ
ncbi:MAG: hypothetical protein ACLQA5_18900 [Solirubrobacteraceae bacterium]